MATGTVVWVANRQIPLTNSSGVLKLTDQGTLVILDANDTTIWSSNSAQSAKNPNAQHLDSGNLVVKKENDSDSEKFLWQSFDYPCDTLIPGMKFGRNRVTGLDRYLSSWKTSNDPSVGNFTYRLDPAGSPQLLVRNGSAVTFRSGPWNGLRFSGFPQFSPNSVYSYAFIFNDKEMYYTLELLNSSVITRLVLSPEGFVLRFTSGFKNSAESGTTRPIRNRLGPNHVDTDTRYETCMESIETLYNSLQIGKLGQVPETTRWTL